jgi:hypothetical protein
MLSLLLLLLSQATVSKDLALSCIDELSLTLSTAWGEAASAAAAAVILKD